MHNLEMDLVYVFFLMTASLVVKMNHGRSFPRL
jgi:hypothetical protein